MVVEVLSHPTAGSARKKASVTRLALLLPVHMSTRRCHSPDEKKKLMSNFETVVVTSELQLVAIIYDNGHRHQK